jgi:hypothetical protein
MEEEQKYQEKKGERRIRDRLRMIGKARRYGARYIYDEPDNPTDESRRWSDGWPDVDNNLHYSMESWEDVFLARESFARRTHNNITVCSCYLCGNGRKYNKSMTVQEARAEEAARQEFRENGINYKGVRFTR